MSEAIMTVCVLATILLPLVAGQAAPQQPGPTIKVIDPIFGTDFRDAPFRRLGREIGEPPTLWFPSWTGRHRANLKVEAEFHLYWKSKGLGFALEQDRFKAAYFYNEAADGYRRYQGELPAGLSFDWGIAETVKKLGPPVEPPEVIQRETGNAGKLIEELWYFYPTIQVNFRRLARSPETMHSVFYFPGTPRAPR